MSVWFHRSGHYRNWYWIVFTPIFHSVQPWTTMKSEETKHPEIWNWFLNISSVELTNSCKQPNHQRLLGNGFHNLVPWRGKNLPHITMVQWKTALLLGNILVFGGIHLPLKRRPSSLYFWLSLQEVLHPKQLKNAMKNPSKISKLIQLIHLTAWSLYIPPTPCKWSATYWGCKSRF